MTWNKHTKITQVSKTDDMELQLSVFIYYNLQNNFSWYNCFLKPHYYQAQFNYNQAIHKDTVSNKTCSIFEKGASDVCTAWLGITQNF